MANRFCALCPPISDKRPRCFEDRILKTPEFVSTLGATHPQQPEGGTLPRLSVCQIANSDWQMEVDVAQYKAARIESIGVRLQKLLDLGEDKAQDLLLESELNVSSLSWAGGFTGSDGLSFLDSLEDAYSLLKIAGDVQARTLVLVSGSRDGHTLNHAKRMFRHALLRLADVAGELGVNLAIQPVADRQSSFVSTVKEMVDLLDLCQHRRIGIVFDVAHWSQEPLIETALLLAPFVKLAVIPAQREVTATAGTVELMSTLEKGGYRGYYEMQLNPSFRSLETYARRLSAARSAFVDWRRQMSPFAEAPPAVRCPSSLSPSPNSPTNSAEIAGR